MLKSFVNKYIENIRPYTVCSHKIWSLDKKTKQQALKLDWNEATIPPSPLVVKEVKKLVDTADFYNLYPSCENKTLLQALAKYINLPVENVQYFASSDSLHEYIAKTYLMSGDTVLIQGPSYDNFRLTAEANGATVKISEIDDNFNFNSENFEKDIKHYRPKLIYIVNPNNPVGYCHSTDYIEHLLKSYPNTLFLIDEAYAEFSGVTCKDLIGKYQNILITRTMSKAFALANFRIGYLIASSADISAISKIRNPKNITTINQVAAIAALNDVGYMRKYVSEVSKAKTQFMHSMQKYKKYVTVYPSQSNFMVMRFETEYDKSDLYEWLENHNVFVRILSQSKMLNTSLRITIGTTTQMKIVEKIIDDFYKKRADEKIALFDFCDTCVCFQTADAFIKYVREKTQSTKMRIKNEFRRFLNKTGIIRFLERYTKKPVNKLMVLWQIKGISKSRLENFAAEYYHDKLKPGFVKETIKELEKLKKHGYKIFVVSGGYDIYIKEFVKDFSLNGLFATKIQFKNNIATGKFDGMDCMHKNKITILRKYFGGDLTQCESVAYSDSITDLPLLQFCKKGIVVSRNQSCGWAEKYGFKEILHKRA